MSSALKVNWTYGFSKNITSGVHSLSVQGRQAIFYVSSHSGVIYDFENRTQMILQGHCNPITCCAVSADKRWIVTADAGEEPILVVWDSLSGAPVKTIFAPHANGTRALDISGDSLYVTTLSEDSNSPQQEVAIWDWTNETEDAALMRKNSPSHEVHNTIKFDSSDNAEICTTGDGSVCFWTWLDSGLDVYSGKVLKADLGASGGVFTNTVFLPGTGNALTTTKVGSAIYWEGNRGGVQANENRKLRTVSKVIRLVESAINFVETLESGYVVMGCADGAVRFYDHSLRLEAWFEDLMAGPVNSCSFAVQQCPLGEAGKPGSKFWAPDFMVGTTDAFIVGVEALCFEEVNPDDRRGTLLMQGLTDYISNVACHPTRSLVAFASYNGSLQIWDYDMKLLMNLREFNPRGASANPKANTAAARLEASNFLRPVTVAFEPRGDFVAVGFTSGHVKFLDVNTFEDISSFAPSTNSVFGLKFSPSGDYLTCYDDSNHVLLFKRTSKIDPSTMGDEVSNPNNSIFTYLGRVHSHARKITGLEFGTREGLENLVSVAEDRQCVEYDIDGSTVIGGVTPLAEPRPPALDLNAFPSALMWAPAVPGVEGEDRFIVANDEFKIKEYNLDSKQCRKTAISPTYGGPLNCMLPLTKGGVTKHYAYSTGSKVIGVGTLPITGNPHDVIGIVAHPDVVSSIAVSHDGNYIFSCGGNDLSVNMWQVDTSDLVPVNERNDAGKAEMEAFIELLDGGENGPLHSDIKDYFYYCQLRTQGEGSMAKRAITGKIPVTEVPSLARAVGFYPSEEEVASMIAEVRYSTFMDTGRLEEEINMGDFIKLYVNHRPVLPLNNAQILNAFETVAKSVGKEDAVSWAELSKLLVSEGEAIGSADLGAYLEALMGQGAFPEAKDEYDGYRFADNVLGFEGD